MTRSIQDLKEPQLLIADIIILNDIITDIIILFVDEAYSLYTNGKLLYV